MIPMVDDQIVDSMVNDESDSTRCVHERSRKLAGDRVVAIVVATDRIHRSNPFECSEQRTAIQSAAVFLFPEYNIPCMEDSCNFGRGESWAEVIGEKSMRVGNESDVSHSSAFIILRGVGCTPAAAMPSVSCVCAHSKTSLTHSDPCGVDNSGVALACTRRIKGRAKALPLDAAAAMASTKVQKIMTQPIVSATHCP